MSIHDPKVNYEQIKLSFDNPNNINRDKNNGCWEKESELSNVFEGADAAIFLTEWDEYRNLNWEKISQAMRKPSWIFDTRGILEKEKIINLGLNFWSIGLGS